MKTVSEAEFILRLPIDNIHQISKHKIFTRKKHWFKISSIASSDNANYDEADTTLKLKIAENDGSNASQEDDFEYSERLLIGDSFQKFLMILYNCFYLCSISANIS